MNQKCGWFLEAGKRQGNGFSCTVSRKNCSPDDTLISPECCSTWGLVPPKESDRKEQGRSCDDFMT